MERKVLHDEQDVNKYLSLLDTSCLAVDTETAEKENRTSMYSQVSNYKLCPEGTWYKHLVMTGVSLCDGKYNLYIPVHDANETRVVPLLIDFFNRVERIVAHNWVFDAKVMHKYGIYWANTKRFDTMIAHHLLDENSSHSLKKLTREILGREVADFSTTLNHYNNKFYDYALDDSLNTYLLYKSFLPQLKEQGLWKLFFNIEMPFQECLLEMQINGVDIDKGLLSEQQRKIKEEIIRLETNMYDLLEEKYSLQVGLSGEVQQVVGKYFSHTTKRNFTKASDIITILFETLGLECTDYTDTGKPSTGKDVIAKYKTNPFVAVLYKHKIATKLYDGFLSPTGQIASNIQVDGKVRPDFWDFGTKTGRLSCSNPNLQQLPKPRDDYAPVNVREVFKAPHGYKMFSCDYSGQEVAVAAQVSRDPTLITDLKNGYDVHLAIANKFYNLGIPEECLNKKHPEHDSYKKKYSDARTKAKVITFGLMYGKGAYGFAKDFGVTEDEAQKIVDDYFKEVPVLKKCIENTHKELEKKGFVTNLAGRKRRFEKNDWGYSGLSYRQSFNFLIQGFSADMIRAAMVTVNKNKHRHPEWNLQTVMTVHDEAVYVVKEEYAKQASLFVKKCFENVCRKFVVPVKADIDIGDNYGSAK